MSSARSRFSSLAQILALPVLAAALFFSSPAVYACDGAECACDEACPEKAGAEGGGCSGEEKAEAGGCPHAKTADAGGGCPHAKAAEAAGECPHAKAAAAAGVDKDAGGCADKADGSCACGKKAGEKCACGGKAGDDCACADKSDGGCACGKKAAAEGGAHQMAVIDPETGKLGVPKKGEPSDDDAALEAPSRAAASAPQVEQGDGGVIAVFPPDRSMKAVAKVDEQGDVHTGCQHNAE